MNLWILLVFLFLLQPTIEGAFSSYLKKLLRGTTHPPIKKGRPVDQGEEVTGETAEPTDLPGTSEGPIGTSIPGGTQPPATGGPQGTTVPPQPSSGAPPSPGPTGPAGSTSTAPSTTTRCSVGIWSEWREDMSCNAECGACGTVVRRRTCTTAVAGCPCDGNFRESRPCRISACPYPQPSCCPPATLIYVNGTFACGPQNDIVMAEYLKEIAARASTTTRSPTTALIATRPHRTSPSGANGELGGTTTAPAPGTTPGPSPAPTGGPQPTGPPGTEPTGEPGTTKEPEPSTGAPGERTTDGGEKETTPAGEEDEMDARPWYHRLKPMQKRPVTEENVETTTEEEEDDSDPRPWYHRLKPVQKTIKESATPMWLQFMDLA